MSRRYGNPIAFIRLLCCVLGLGLLLGGCTLASRFTRPEAPVPASWPEGAAYQEIPEAAGAPAAAEIPWRHFFTDVELQKLIAAALENNRDLRLAALNVQRARGVYGIQRAALFPTLDATANGLKQRVPADLSSSGERRTVEQYDVNLGVFAWEIDFFGRLRSLKAQALEAFLATEEARRSTQILIVSAVAQTYLALAADRETLALAQTTYNNQLEVYRIVKRRYDVGLASELDVNRSQTQVDVARGDIARYRQLVAQDENALNLLVGAAAPRSPVSWPEHLGDVAAFEGVSAGLSSQVLLDRPDILRAEHRLKAAHADIGAARAALFPRIALTTTVGTASAELSGLFTSGSGTWLFAPQVVMPVFDPRLWAALDVAEAEREIAVAAYEQAIQTAFREVADTLAVTGTVDQQLSAQTSLVRAAEATYRLSQARYSKGIDSYLSVLDAQRALYAAQQGLVALHLAKRANEVQLYAALGGGAD